MEATTTKSFTLAIAAMSALFLLSTEVCTTNAVESRNETTPSLFSAGHPEKGLIGDADRQSEFMWDSEINRMLADLNSKVISPGALVKDIPAVKCGRGKPYVSCLPPPNPRRPQQKCDRFTRGC